VTLEFILRRDRWVVASGLALVLMLAWAYLLAGAGMGVDAHAVAGMAMGGTHASQWSLGLAAVMFLMWWVMMAAMMLPSAAPVLLLAAALNRKSRPGNSPYGATGLFAAGYLAAWACFSLVAVAAQWWLTYSGNLSEMMQLSSRQLAGGLLVCAGLWQLTPIKHACLRQCRSPVEFLTQRRRPGKSGVLIMGIEHGTYCLGCCWLLMALLFAGGIMNLYWVAGLAVYVLGEKLLPAGHRIARWASAALLVAGVALTAGWV
jgi:predicted metal-binding membrane protein